jgi:DNA primase
MNAVEYINANMDPLAILDYYGFRHVQEYDEEIRSCCEIHKGNDPTAFIWNKRNNLWFCYTGPCHGGDVFTLVEKMEGKPFAQAVEKVADILGLDIQGMQVVEPVNRIIKDFRRWKQLQQHYGDNRVDAGMEEYEWPYTRYKEEDPRFTRFRKETIAHFQSVFADLFPTENHLLRNKLAIPLFQSGRRIGVALRDLTGTQQLKWYYVPKGIQTGHILYNYDEAMTYIREHDLDELILTEGIFDVWAYHEAGIKNVVAIFGSSLKEPQYQTILKGGLDLVLSFDNDQGGQKCTDAVRRKFRHKASVRVVQLPEGKDPADCSKEELIACYASRR